ncbi:MAG: relaxase/mobilization nuclease domain-containing protein [Steroidobacteraceae bacterium]
MPAETPPDKVLAAAKNLARENFARHRYVMALHTHQRNPHVHLVVKEEREIEPGRLHIDKATLRKWRQDFARLMREQGIAANATSQLAARSDEAAD